MALVVLSQLGNWSANCCSSCLLRLCDLLPLLLLVRHDYLRLGNCRWIGHNERLTAIFLHGWGSAGAMRLRPGWGLSTALALLMVVMVLANAFALQHLLKLLWLDPNQFVLVLLLGVLALDALAYWYVSGCLHLSEGQLHHLVDRAGGCFSLGDSRVRACLGFHHLVWCLLELNTIRPQCELIRTTWLVLLLLLYLHLVWWNLVLNLRVSNSEGLVGGPAHSCLLSIAHWLRDYWHSWSSRIIIAIQHLIFNFLAK